MNNLPTELIVIIAGTVGWTIVSAIAGWLKKQRELAGGGAPDEAAPSTEASDIDEAAARRRDELRKLTQARMGADAPTAARPASPAPLEPTNLSMAERIARARAKEQYQARTRELRQQQPAPAAPPRTPPPVATDAADTAAGSRGRQGRLAERQTRRAAEAAQEREQAQRRAQGDALAEQQRRAQQQTTRPASQRRAQPASTPPRVLQPPTPGRTHVDHANPRGDDRIAQQTLLGIGAASQVTRAPASAGQAPAIGLLRGRSLREAFILKEVLDRPVALRGPDSGVEL